MKYQSLMEKLLALLPFWQYKISQSLKRAYKKEAMSLDTYYCLQMLHWNGPMTMSELAKSLNITKQQATRTIEKLWKAEFVRRLYDPDDRRTIRIEVTDTALAYIEKNFHEKISFQKRVEACLTENEAREFEGAVETLLRILPKLD